MTPLLPLLLWYALVALGCWRVFEVLDRNADEASRNRIAARQRATEVVRVATSRERLLREVRLAMCEQRARAEWGDPRDVETLSVRKVAA